MLPDLGKKPLDAEVRRQSLPFMMDDLHGTEEDRRLQTKTPRDLGLLAHSKDQPVQTRQGLFGQRFNLTSLRIIEIAKTLGQMQEILRFGE